MKIHRRGMFHHYSISGCQVKNFQRFAYQFIIHEMALFGRFWGPCSLKYDPIFPKFLLEVVL